MLKLRIRNALMIPRGGNKGGNMFPNSWDGGNKTLEELGITKRKHLVEQLMVNEVNWQQVRNMIDY